MTRPRSLWMSRLPAAGLSVFVAAACAPGRSSSPKDDTKRAGTAERASAAPERVETPAATTPSPEQPSPSGDAVVEAAPAMAGQQDALAGSKLDVAEPMIDGGLSRDIIRRKAQDHEADLRACHASALAGDPELGGTVALELEVDARGIVTDVALGDGTDLDDRSVVDCILEHVARWSFAGDATGAAKVELRLDLTSAD